MLRGRWDYSRKLCNIFFNVQYSKQISMDTLNCGEIYTSFVFFCYALIYYAKSMLLIMLYNTLYWLIWGVHYILYGLLSLRTHNNNMCILPYNLDNTEYGESAGLKNACGIPPDSSENPGFRTSKIHNGEFCWFIAVQANLSIVYTSFIKILRLS